MAEKIRLTKSVMVSLNAVAKAIALEIGQRSGVEILDVKVGLEVEKDIGTHECGDLGNVCRLCSTKSSQQHSTHSRTMKLVGRYEALPYFGHFDATCEVWRTRGSGTRISERQYIHRIDIVCDYCAPGHDRRHESDSALCVYDYEGSMSFRFD